MYHQIYSSKGMFKTNYDIYRSIKTDLQTKGIEVNETNITGPLISSRLISPIHDSEIKMETLRKYDSVRAQMLQKKKGKLMKLVRLQDWKQRL